MDEVKKEIQARLQELEQEESVCIFYACESGSRAWGFPSANSDYDVRFLYIHHSNIEGVKGSHKRDERNGEPRLALDGAPLRSTPQVKSMLSNALALVIRGWKAKQRLSYLSILSNASRNPYIIACGLGGQPGM